MVFIPRFIQGRVGPASMLALAVASLGALAGCPNSSGPAAPLGDGAPDDATADAAASIGTASAEASFATADAAADVETADVADSAQVPQDGVQIERETTLVLAAPDLPPQYVCFIGFPADAYGAPMGAPVGARGPWGIPDPADPNVAAVFAAGALDLPVKLTSGFPYGALLRLGIRKRDALFFDRLAGVLFTTSQVDAAVFAGNGIDSTTCRNAWSSRDAGATPIFAIKPGQIQVGQSWLAGLSGCEQVSTDPQCGGGANLTATVTLLDLDAPGAFAGAGDTPVAIQIANLAPYAGYQNVDVYIQPMKAAAEAGASPVPDGAPLLVSAADGGVDWTHVTPRAAGVQLASANASLTELLVAPHGQGPSCAGQPGCSVTVIPVQPFIDKYASTTKAGWSGHQTLVLFGRPPLTPTETAASVLRLGVFSSSIGGG